MRREHICREHQEDGRERGSEEGPRAISAFLLLGPRLHRAHPLRKGGPRAGRGRNGGAGKSIKEGPWLGRTKSAEETIRESRKEKNGRIEEKGSFGAEKGDWKGSASQETFGKKGIVRTSVNSGIFTGEEIHRAFTITKTIHEVERGSAVDGYKAMRRI
ncbi:hypothetical protein [Candidatus Solincola tengchongensis]|uniref:hypothetical protein n=1 Tax=Candidatus Solincola tengchongensis TaxID=2900693 RepID=UPI00257F2984|nr:hypothetical protein [Candidatus Solincola tengchongensis]